MIFCQRVSRSCWIAAIRWWIQETASCPVPAAPGVPVVPGELTPGGDRSGRGVVGGGGGKSGANGRRCPAAPPAGAGMETSVDGA